jgi:hypothetical protein
MSTTMRMPVRMYGRWMLVGVALASAVLPAHLAEAGRLPLPGISYNRVEAFDTDVFLIPFRGCEEGWIRVDGDGDTDLDLFVYDACGRLIGKDDDSLDLCIVRFWVSRTQTLRVEVRNLGGVYNAYTLETN